MTNPTPETAETLALQILELERLHKPGYVLAIKHLAVKLAARVDAERTQLMKIELSEMDLQMIVDAIDSHIYTLADDEYRNDGAVLPPGADDEETVALIEGYQGLLDRCASDLLYLISERKKKVAGT